MEATHLTSIKQIIEEFNYSGYGNIIGTKVIEDIQFVEGV